MNFSEYFKENKKNLISLMEGIGLLESRNDFLRLIPKGTIGAELGVFQGEFSKVLLSVANPKELHLIDTWWLIGDEYYGDWTRKYNNGELLRKRKAYEQTKANVESMQNSEVVTIHVANDIECLKKFGDHYFDWIYLDSSHTYEQTKAELEILNFKVKEDGIILGDDWKAHPNHMHYGMRIAIQEFCDNFDWVIKRINARKEQWCIKRK